jgi:hypothetical protein
MDDPIAGCVAVIVVLAGLVGAIALIIKLVQWHDERNQARAETLNALAARWGGEVKAGYFAADHELSLRVDGVSGQVSFNAGSKHEQAWTRLQFDWRTPRRLRVAPGGFSDWLMRLFGAVDLEFGDPPFDEAFEIESSDAEWAREILDAPLRARLVRLHESGYGSGNGNVTLDVGPSGVSLRMAAMLVDETAALESFIELGVEVLRRLRGGGEAGVVLAAVELRGGSECPVCGHPVEGGRTCPRCATPHHEDCWKYFGGCSIYGCPGREAA